MTRLCRYGLLTGLLLGCTGGWRELPGLPPAGFPEGTVVLLGTRHGTRQLVNVHIDGDSIRGVNGGQSYSCLRCRVAVATADVTSIQIIAEDDPQQSGFIGGVILGFAGFWAYVLLR